MHIHLQLLIHLCKLHMRQFFRLLAEIGLARIVILSIIGLLFLMQLLPFIQFSSIWAFVLPILPALIFFSLFNSEKFDLQSEYSFLKAFVPSPVLIRLLRNILFALPFLIILIIHKNFQAFGIGIILSLLLAIPSKFQFNEKQFLLFKTPQTVLVPWTIAIRKGLLIYVIVLVCGMLQLLHVSFIFFAIFILHLRILSVLQFNESQILLQSYNRKANSFLNNYLKKHLIYYSLFTLPLLIMTAILSIQTFLILSFIFLLLLIHQWLSIYLKFSFYEPGKDNSDMQSIQTLMLAFLLIPFTLPIPFLYLWRYRKRAIQNLNVYL